MLSTKGKVKNLLDGLRLSSRTEIINSFYDLINTESSSTPVPVYRGLDIDSLFNAVMADSGSADDWKASFTIEFPAEGAVVNGQFETNGDFLTEESTSNIVGILKDTEEGEDAKTTIIASSKFKPTSGTTLNGIEISAAGNVYDFDNFTWKYKYEENPTATGSDPMYMHDFTFSVDSTQINGYVLIGADDSVIAANIDGFMPSAGGGGGSCDAALNFNIGLSSFDANSNMIGVDTFTGNNFSGALEIRSVEGSPVATSYAGPAQNLDFFMPVIDQSASDDYEYILTLMDDNTGCVYCAIGNPITLVLNDPMQSQTANNDVSGMGCGSLFAASPAASK
jgi:hypothetical protein